MGVRVEGQSKRHGSEIRAISTDRVQGRLRGERRDRGKVRTIYRTRVQVYESRVG